MKLDGPSSLAETLTTEVEGAWRTMLARHPGDTFYAFGLHTNDVALYPSIVACTEEDLPDTRESDAVAIAMNLRLYRWRLADSSLFEEGEAMLPMTQAIRESEPDPYGDGDEAAIEGAIEAFFSTSFSVLQQLDRRGVFGTGAERERLILSVWLDDESHDSRVQAAARLNSSKAVERHRFELEDGLKAFHERQAMRASSRT